ncbi:MAG: PAS domain S-box protein [Chitinophagaceae bacterium]
MPSRPKKVNATLESLRALEDVMDDMQDIETGQRGYIISGSREFLIPYQSALKKLPQDTIEIKALYGLYPSRKETFGILLRLVKHKTELAEASVKSMDDFGADSAHQRIQSGKGKSVMDSIRNIISSIETEDRFVLQSSNAQWGIAAKNTAKLFIVLVGTFVAGLFIVFWRIYTGFKRKEKYEQQISYLADLTEKTSDAIFSVDKHGVILSWNKGAEDIYGYSREEVIGKYAPDVTGSRWTREETAKMVEKVLQNGSLALETLNYNKKGEAIQCLGSVSPLKNEQGEATGYVAVVRDITERKKAEQMLKGFNEELSRQVEEKTLLIKSVLARISDGFYSLNEDWCLTYINSTAARIMSCDENEIIGKNIWEEYPEAKDHSIYKTFTTAFQKQAYEQVEIFYPPFNKWFMVQVYPSPSGLSVFFRDITEIKKTETDIRQTNERFEMISKTTNDAIWEWNLETGQMWVNETHQQLYGLTMADPVPDVKQWQERLHPDERAFFIKKQEEALASDTNIFITEYRFRTQTGDYKNIYDRCYIVRNTEGKATRLLGSMMDVTERKKAEMSLKESESKFRAFFENSMDGILLTIPDGRIISANPAACLMFGMAEEEICNAGRNGLTDSNDSRLNPALSERKETGKAKRELTLVRKDGSKFPAEVSSSIFLDIHGEERTSMIIRDITERKETEKRLRRREAQLVASIENTPNVAVQWYNDNGEVLFWNHASELIFGFGASETIGKRLDQLIFISIPTEFARFTSALKQVEQTGRTIGPIEFCFNRRDGSLGYCISTIFSIPSIGGEPCFVCMDVDITESKKAQEKILREKELSDTLINSLPGVFYMIDGNRNFLRWNKNFEKVTGYSSSEISQILPVDFFAEEDRPLARQKVEETFRTGAAELEAQFLTKQGDKIHYYCTGLAISYEGVPCMIGTGIDITARKIAEAALKESKEKLRHILSSTAEDFYVIDREYRVILINAVARQNLLKVWGREVATGTNILKILPPDKRESIKRNYDLVFTGERIEYEISNNIDNKLIWKLVNYIPVSDEKGIITGAYITTKDITERKKAEEEIVKTNARFQIVTRATSDIVWDWNIKDNSLWWNDNYYATLGYRKQKEIVSIEEWYGRIHPDDFKRIKDYIHRTIEGEASFWRDEYRYKKSDGSYLHILDRGYIIRGNEGKAYRMIGSMVDMTPIYNVQRKITESENRLRTILDTDPECIKLMDAECRLLDINKAGLEMIEADSLEGTLGKSLLPVVAEEQKDAAVQLIKNVFEGMSGRLEFEMIALKGTHRWCEISAVPFRDTDGKIISALGVTRDITQKKKAEIELRQNEEKYRTLIEQAVDAIALYDTSGKVLDVNTGSVNLLGYSKEELVNMSLREILTEDEIRDNPVRYDVLEQGKSTVKQRKMRRKDGTVVETEVRSQQLPDGRFLSVIRDLTERIKAEKELAESYEAIRKLTSYLQNIREEERTNIAREIHDELGQQLTVLKMDVSWLRKKILVQDEPVKLKLKELTTMLDETVKTVRRISSELRPSLLDDLGLIAAMEWQLSEFEKRSGLITSFIHSGEDLQLPDTIKTALFRIFQESLTNVARHSHAKRVTVSIAQKDDNILLSIADNGKGFDKQKVADKRTFGILGMKERIVMIGGRYEIRSHPGKGTEVIVQVPLNKEI